MAKKISRTIVTNMVTVMGIKSEDKSIVEKTYEVSVMNDKKTREAVDALALKDGIMVAAITAKVEKNGLYVCTEEEFLSIAHYVGEGRTSDKENDEE